MEKVVKIGTAEFTERGLWENVYQKKYVVTYGGVWQVFYSEAQKRFYGMIVLRQKGISRRGRFYLMTGSEINHVLNRDVLNDF